MSSVLSDSQSSSKDSIGFSQIKVKEEPSWDPDYGDESGNASNLQQTQDSDVSLLIPKQENESWALSDLPSSSQYPDADNVDSSQDTVIWEEKFGEQNENECDGPTTFESSLVSADSNSNCYNLKIAAVECNYDASDSKPNLSDFDEQLDSNQKDLEVQAEIVPINPPVVMRLIEQPEEHENQGMNLENDFVTAAIMKSIILENWEDFKLDLVNQFRHKFPHQPDNNVQHILSNFRLPRFPDLPDNQYITVAHKNGVITEFFEELQNELTHAFFKNQMQLLVREEKSISFFLNRGFSDLATATKIVKLIGLKAVCLNFYKSNWNIWFLWSQEHKVNAVNPSPELFLQFLKEMYEVHGKSAQTVIAHKRSALTIVKKAGLAGDSFKHPTVMKFLKEILSSKKKEEVSRISDLVNRKPKIQKIQKELSQNISEPSVSSSEVNRKPKIQKIHNELLQNISESSVSSSEVVHQEKAV